MPKQKRVWKKDAFLLEMRRLVRETYGRVVGDWPDELNEDDYLYFPDWGNGRPVIDTGRMIRERFKASEGCLRCHTECLSCKVERVGYQEVMTLSGS